MPNTKTVSQAINSAYNLTLQCSRNRCITTLITAWKALPEKADIILLFYIQVTFSPKLSSSLAFNIN